MNVRCPHCATSYRLPPELMGAGGARVSCPSCSGAFEVDTLGIVTMRELPTEASTAARSAAEAVTAASASVPLDTARQVLADLAALLGGEIEDSISRGCLFSEHGPRLVEAYDAYRRLAGRKADAAPFREALRERWGVDLTPHWGETETR